MNLKFEPINNNHALIKNHVDSLAENSWNGRDFFSIFNVQDKEFDEIKLTKLDSFTIKRNPLLDEEVSIKTYIDDELDKNTIFRFNQTLQRFLKFPSEKLFLNSKNRMNNTFWIQQYLKTQIKEAIFCNSGIKNVTIKTKLNK